LCCSGLLGGASGDAWMPAANGSIFSRAAENVFSHLARTGPQREKLRSFYPDFERVFARGGGRGMGGVSGRPGGLAGQPVCAGRWSSGGAAGARAPCDKGFGGLRRSPSPLKSTVFRLVGGAGCPQCRALRPIWLARSPFGCTGFRVAWRPGCPHPESVSGSFGCRRSPLEFTVRRVGFGGGYPHRDRLVSSIFGSPSPLENTGSRVGSVAGYSHRNTHAARSRDRARGRRWTGLRVAAVADISVQTSTEVPATRASSPFETTAIRVASVAVVRARAGIPVGLRAHPHR